jgi:hypothetical protein
MLTLYTYAGIKFIPIEVSTQSENELGLIQNNNSRVFAFIA